MRVRCYYNLQKKTFSIVDTATGRVIRHADSVHLSNVKFHVREGGRQRVLREQRKNVHAFVTGDLLWAGDLNLKITHYVHEAYYNPYHCETFIDKGNDQPVYKADVAILQNRKVFYN